MQAFFLLLLFFEFHFIFIFHEVICVQVKKSNSTDFNKKGKFPALPLPTPDFCFPQSTFSALITVSIGIALHIFFLKNVYIAIARLFHFKLYVLTTLL